MKRTAASATVEEFLHALEHPLKKEVLALRQIILAADPSIEEGIKWNVPSFRTSEYFATFHLRAKAGVQIILHLGAKKRDTAKSIVIPDPDSLLVWLGKDRASVHFVNGKDVMAKSAAFEMIIRQWIAHVK